MVMRDARCNQQVVAFAPQAAARVFPRAGGIACGGDIVSPCSTEGCGKSWWLASTSPPGEELASCILVRNLPNEITSREVHRFFDGCPGFLRSELIMESGVAGSNLGSALVVFDSPHAARQAVVLRKDSVLGSGRGPVSLLVWAGRKEADASSIKGSLSEKARLRSAWEKLDAATVARDPHALFEAVADVKALGVPDEDVAAAEKVLLEERMAAARLAAAMAERARVKLRQEQEQAGHLQDSARVTIVSSSVPRRNQAINITGAPSGWEEAIHLGETARDLCTRAGLKHRERHLDKYVRRMHTARQEAAISKLETAIERKHLEGLAAALRECEATGTSVAPPQQRLIEAARRIYSGASDFAEEEARAEVRVALENALSQDIGAASYGRRLREALELATKARFELVDPELFDLALKCSSRVAAKAAAHWAFFAAYLAALPDNSGVMAASVRRLQSAWALCDEAGVSKEQLHVMADKLIEMGHAATLSDAFRHALRTNDFHSLQKAMSLVRTHCPKLLSWNLMLKGMKLLKRARRDDRLLMASRERGPASPKSAAPLKLMQSASESLLAELPAIDIDEVVGVGSQGLGRSQDVDGRALRKHEKEGGLPSQLSAAREKLQRALSHPILFEADSATIAAAGRPAINRLIVVLRELPDVKLLLQGHSVHSNHTFAMRLSQLRAEAVKAELLSSGCTNSMFIKGWGNSNPGVNRRVVIVSTANALSEEINE
mmetsp:Transcript_5884/g.12913  ORF Transcript_5884/g.12913 Transcript_5884/m.12913 type:complete len:725 (+) Transcript_5884:59-2233(+)